MNNKAKNVIKEIRNIILFLIIYNIAYEIVQKLFSIFENGINISTLFPENVSVPILFVYAMLTKAAAVMLGVYVAHKIIKLFLKITYKDAKKMLITMLVLLSIFQAFVLKYSVEDMKQKKEQYSYIVTNYEETVLNSEAYNALEEDDNVKKSVNEMHDMYKENVDELLKLQDKKFTYRILDVVCSEIIYIGLIYFYGKKLYLKDESKIEELEENKIDETI